MVDYAPFGIIGLETALPLCYTELVAESSISPLSTFHDRPRRSARHRKLPVLAEGRPADIVIFDPALLTIDADKFKSNSRNTPFNGREVEVQVLGYAGQQENGLLRRMKTLADILPGIIEFPPPCTGFRR